MTATARRASGAVGGGEALHTLRDQLGEMRYLRWRHNGVERCGDGGDRVMLNSACSSMLRE